MQWARLGLDTAILLLGFGGFFWFCVIAPTAAAQHDPDVLKYVLAQSYIALNCLMLLACGVLLMHSGAAPIRRRALMLLTLGFSSMSLADIVWAMSKVGGSYLPGGVSDAIYLSCYVWLAAAAREQLRGRRAARRAPGAFSSALIQGMPYIAMMVSFLVLVYVESSSASEPGQHDDDHHLRADLARHGAPGRALARRRAAARAAGGRPRRGPLRVPDQERLRRDHDHRRRRAACDSPRRRRSAPSRSTRTTWWAATCSTCGPTATASGWPRSSPRCRRRAAGPSDRSRSSSRPGERRSTLECVGSNLMDDPAIAGLALNFRDVTERKALEEQLRKLAFHDPLTLLANRSLFWNRVEHALTLAQRTQQRVAVMFLDLDNFKNVNDSLGHDAGDRLLQAAAQRLVKSTRPSDTVARLGGDEFAILLEGIRSDTDVERIAVPITRGLQPAPAARRQGNRCHGEHRRRPARSPATTPSSCCATPTSPCTTRRPPARRAACVFQPHMQEQLHDRLRLEQDIDLALARNEFFVEFQPVVDLTSRELLGVEALVRWNHPQRGIVMPG